MKNPSGDQRRLTLRASDVPVALMDKLPLLVARIDADLRFVGARVIRTSRYTMVVDIDVVGSLLPDASFRFDDLGMLPVVVKRLPPRRSVAPVVRALPKSAVPAPRRPLSSDERVSWADVARGAPISTLVISSQVDSTSASSRIAPVSSPSASLVASTPTPATSAPMEINSEDEIPLRSLKSGKKGKARIDESSPSRVPDSSNRSKGGSKSKGVQLSVQKAAGGKSKLDAYLLPIAKAPSPQLKVKPPSPLVAPAAPGLRRRPLQSQVALRPLLRQLGLTPFALRLLWTR